MSNQPQQQSPSKVPTPDSTSSSLTTTTNTNAAAAGAASGPSRGSLRPRITLKPLANPTKLSVSPTATTLISTNNVASTPGGAPADNGAGVGSSSPAKVPLANGSPAQLTVSLAATAMSAQGTSTTPFFLKKQDGAPGATAGAGAGAGGQYKTFPSALPSSSTDGPGSSSSTSSAGADGAGADQGNSGSGAAAGGGGGAGGVGRQYSTFPRNMGSTTNNPTATSSPSPVSPSMLSPLGSPSSANRRRMSMSAMHVDDYINKLRNFATLENAHRQRHIQGRETANPNEQRFISLPRGGTFVNTALGSLQFGCPPETIKDSMSMGLKLPTHFVLPQTWFDVSTGINCAEFEFPAYFNFFIKKQRINLIVHKHVEPRIREVFKLTLLGPDDVKMPLHFSTRVPREAYPDLNKEMSNFRVNPFTGQALTVDTILEFTHFDDNGVATLEQLVEDGKNPDDTPKMRKVCVEIKELPDESAYEVFEDGVSMGKVADKVVLTPDHPALREKERREREMKEGALNSPTPSPLASASASASGAGAGAGSAGSGSAPAATTASAFAPAPTTASAFAPPSTFAPASSSSSSSSSATPLRNNLGLATVLETSSDLKVGGVSGAGGRVTAPPPSSSLPWTAPPSSRRVSFSSPHAISTLDAADGTKTEIFVPPPFGVTMLGVSDGFDAQGTTTGMVIWMNRRGYMVDPPPYSSHLLKSYGIQPRLIKGVILTHCHADHDAGTFQKILEEEQIVLITTQVILDCFVAKYKAISNLGDVLDRLFVPRPAIVGDLTAVYGGYIEFFYSLHSIPCVGFVAHCNGKSLIYSGDTYNDEAGIKRLYEKGLMTKERCEKLVNFQWHHDFILHEAGVPPIHTPFSTLVALPPDVKQRLRVVHTNPGKFPKEVIAAGLQMVRVGPEHTYTISRDSAPHAEAMEVLDLVASLEWFSDFPIHRAIELVQAARKYRFNPGEVIIEQGSVGDDRIYFIAMGLVKVVIGSRFIRDMTVGDHFGEMSVVLGTARSATIRAESACELIGFDKHDFLHLARGTQALEKLQKIAMLQKEPSWQVFGENSALVRFTPSQKNMFLSMVTQRSVSAGEVIWSEQTETDQAILIVNGQFQFQGSKTVFSRGEMIGDMRVLSEPTKPCDPPILNRHTLCALTDGFVCSISKSNLHQFFQKNPGIMVFMKDRYFIDTIQGEASLATSPSFVVAPSSNPSTSTTSSTSTTTPSTSTSPATITPSS